MLTHFVIFLVSKILKIIRKNLYLRQFFFCGKSEILSAKTTSIRAAVWLLDTLKFSD